jgi:hypothetical protein
MYTLRKITSDGVQMNTFLGKEYNFIEQFSSPFDFERCFENFFKAPINFVETNPPSPTYDGSTINAQYVSEMKELVYAFVTSEGGREIFPLYKRQRNYIMSESGATFSNLTHR